MRGAVRNGCKRFHTDARDRKYSEKFRQVWLYLFLIKYIKAMTFLVFDPEANNVLL
jgi:hypothetical protein